MVGETEQNSMFNKKGLRKHALRDRYEDAPLSIDVELIRTDGIITDIERVEIERWLFHRAGFEKLFMISEVCPGGIFPLQTDEDGYAYYLNCRFLHPVKIENDAGIIGYRATLEADAPFAWVEEREYEFTLTGGSASANSAITVRVNSDLPEYIWPRVTIQTGNVGGNVTIVNQSDDPARLTSFSGLTNTTQVIMNGETNYISGQNYVKFSDKNFIRLRDGLNQIIITGDVVSIKISFRNRRYL